MQRQLEKITDLVQLIVQKMEIRTEIGIDDRSKYDRKENCITTQHLRQTRNFARHENRFRTSTKNNVSNTVGHSNV